jgi:hypothetical protein
MQDSSKGKLLLIDSPGTFFRIECYRSTACSFVKMDLEKQLHYALSAKGRPKDRTAEKLSSIEYGHSKS